MDNINNVNDNAATAKTAAVKAKKGSSSAFRVFALVGLIVAIIAWVFFPISGTASLILAIVGCVVSAIGCRLKPGNMRNVAITGVIASSVLLLVFAVFTLAYNLI